MVCCIQSVYHTFSLLGDSTTYAASLIPRTFMILCIAVVVTVALLPLEFQVWWLAWCHPTMDGQRRKVHSQSALHKQWAPSTKSAHSDYLTSCCLKMSIHLVPYSTCFGAEQMYVSSVMAWLNHVSLPDRTNYSTCCFSDRVLMFTLPRFQREPVWKGEVVTVKHHFPKD